MAEGTRGCWGASEGRPDQAGTGVLCFRTQTLSWGLGTHPGSRKEVAGTWPHGMGDGVTLPSSVDPDPRV